VCVGCKRVIGAKLMVGPRLMVAKLVADSDLMVAPDRVGGPHRVVVGRSLVRRRGVMVASVATAVGQEGGNEAFGANPQRQRPIPSRHEARWNERSQRKRQGQEAGEPPALTDGCRPYGHLYETRLLPSLHRKCRIQPDG
jgi:hypothetical protein